MAETGSRHRPRKRFGQNFLHDQNTIRRIVENFDADAKLAIVEIGPGKGALTAELMNHYEKIHAIEIDRDLASALGKKFPEPGRLELYQGDALDFDYSTISPQPLQIIGNLPYNISTPLLFYLLRSISLTRVMLFMLQNEVVDRICAPAGDSSYGRLSVMIQSRCHVRKLFEIPASAFTPQPKVTSALVRVQPDPALAETILDTAVFEKLVRQAFSQRRKTIRKALRGTVNSEDLDALGIRPDLRPGELQVSDYVALSNQLYDKSPG